MRKDAAVSLSQSELRALGGTRGGVPKLAARGVTKTYRGARGGEVTALLDVTLEVDPGEFVCLIGPSGCGKTTLLNLFAGLERPDAGTVEIDGRPVEGPGPDRAVLFQEPALFPWLSVLGNVEFALELIGVPRDERRDRAMEWLRKVHLARFARAQPHELSGGMRQRAALARALACQPEVLLADEPFAALDAQTREILQEELQRVWTETRNTFVFVTHNVREAVFLADRVVLMSAPPGTLVAEHRIDAPRPRDFEDVLLSKVVVDIHEHLRGEVEKVVAREVGG
ncbi:MAG TPA: ABC transporter ATP-binding protein [Actinomycetota bacterium]|nr:ABC transporter ATP-binding protein [Actinomycetota bacterium]